MESILAKGGIDGSLRDAEVREDTTKSWRDR
jgi:hypothetical protein